MAEDIRKYLDYEGARKLVELTKAEDTKVLNAATAYADSLAPNYDTAGAAETVRANLQAQIDRTQGEVDAVEDYIGEIPEVAESTTIVDYINEMTIDAASKVQFKELSDRMTQAEKDIDAIEADYLTSSDKDELNVKIDKAQDEVDAVEIALSNEEKRAKQAELENKNAAALAQQTADAAQGYAEGVAEDLAEEASARQGADDAQVERISVLEEKILKLNGTMHFKGVKTELPTTFSGYENGDVIIVGNKEYVFDGTKFVEFGDVTAEAEAITALTGRMDGAEEEIDNLQKDMQEAEDAIATKVEQSDYDAKVAELESADEAIDERLDILEGKFGKGEGTVSDMVSKAKTEAIETAAQDATTKANKALDDAKTYTNTEVGKDRARLDGLEADAHTHSNKTELDKIASGDKAKWDEAYNKRHEHGNKAELDKIADGDVAKWNAAEQNAKTYAKGLSDATNGEVDALKGRMTTAEGAIANKAESSTVSALAERVATNESNIASNTAFINSLTPITTKEITDMFA